MQKNELLKSYPDIGLSLIIIDTVMNIKHVLSACYPYPNPFSGFTVNSLQTQPFHMTRFLIGDSNVQCRKFSVFLMEHCLCTLDEEVIFLPRV